MDMERRKDKGKENYTTVLEANISIGTLLLAVVSVFVIIKAIRKKKKSEWKL